MLWYCTCLCRNRWRIYYVLSKVTVCESVSHNVLIESLEKNRKQNVHSSKMTLWPNWWVEKDRIVTLLLTMPQKRKLKGENDKKSHVRSPSPSHRHGNRITSPLFRDNAPPRPGIPRVKVSSFTYVSSFHFISFAVFLLKPKQTSWC